MIGKEGAARVIKTIEAITPKYNASMIQRCYVNSKCLFDAIIMERNQSLFVVNLIIDRNDWLIVCVLSIVNTFK